MGVEHLGAGVYKGGGWACLFKSSGFVKSIFQGSPFSWTFTGFGGINGLQDRGLRTKSFIKVSSMTKRVIDSKDFTFLLSSQILTVWGDSFSSSTPSELSSDSSSSSSNESSSSVFEICRETLFYPEVGFLRYEPLTICCSTSPHWPLLMMSTCRALDLNLVEQHGHLFWSTITYTMSFSSPVSSTFAEQVGQIEK